jgi:hypothetical protein
MGQYHYVVNVDKKQFINPHKLGAGLKLWEQLNNDPSTPHAIFMLLAVSNGRGGGDLHRWIPDPNADEKDRAFSGEYLESELIGSWGGDRIAVIGDYAEETDLPPEFRADKIYGWCSMSEYLPKHPEDYADADPADIAESKRWRDISDDIVPLLEEFCGVVFTDMEGWRSKYKVCPYHPNGLTAPNHGMSFDPTQKGLPRGHSAECIRREAEEEIGYLTRRGILK